jgi:hypothetical protein
VVRRLALLLVVVVFGAVLGCGGGSQPGGTRGGVQAWGRDVTVDHAVGGSVRVSNGSVVVNGSVDGEVRLWNGDLHVNGQVGGDVRVSQGTFALGRWHAPAADRRPSEGDLHEARGQRGAALLLIARHIDSNRIRADRWSRQLESPRADERQPPQCSEACPEQVHAEFRTAPPGRAVRNPLVSDRHPAVGCQVQEHQQRRPAPSRSTSMTGGRSAHRPPDAPTSTSRREF